VTHDQLNRLLALAQQLCDFVQTMPIAESDGWCRISLANAHRAHVTANNLRPLLRLAELSTQPIAAVDKS